MKHPRPGESRGLEATAADSNDEESESGQENDSDDMGNANDSGDAGGRQQDQAGANDLTASASDHE